jgi:hypothetical protein
MLVAGGACQAAATSVATPVGGEIGKFLVSLVQIGRHDNFQLMRDLILLAIYLLVTLAKFLGPGGVRRVAAESLLLKHQLDQQSLMTACAKSHHPRSPCAWADYPICEPTSHSEAVRESQAGVARR